MSEPLVGVGLLTYNRPEGLRQALLCLTRQTYRNLDIVVADNASAKPGVAEVLREFADDPRVRVFRHETNIGALANFRFVYEQTRGEYFMWAADDDEWDSEFIEVCLRNLLEPKNRAVLSFCHVRRRDAQGRIVTPRFADPVSSNSPSLLARSFRYLYHSGGNHCFYGLYRKSSINPWIFTKRFGVDHLFLLVLLREGCIHIDDRVLFTSTIGGGGFERSGFHKYYESRFLKICVTLSSTLTWCYEFLRCIALTPYRPHEKAALWLFTLIRFCRPRYWRRFAGDLLALATRRDIWRFTSP